MRFEIHRAGAPSPATLIAEFLAWDYARAAFDSHPDAWAIVPTGTAEELAPLGSLSTIAPRHSGGCYVISEGGGVSCLGFDVVERKRAAVAAWLAREGAPVKESAAAMVAPSGSPDAFARYRAIMLAAAEHCRATGRRCDAELTPQLVGLEGKRVRVIRDNGEEARFRVGKSGGWLPIHLEISGRSDGGPGVYGAPFKSVTIL